MNVLGVWDIHIQPYTPTLYPTTLPPYSTETTDENEDSHRRIVQALAQPKHRDDPANSRRVLCDRVQSAHAEQDTDENTGVREFLQTCRRYTWMTCL